MKIVLSSIFFLVFFFIAFEELTLHTAHSYNLPEHEARSVAQVYNGNQLQYRFFQRSLLTNLSNPNYKQHFYYDKALVLTGTNAGKTCNHRAALIHSFKSAADFENMINNINWDPCCLLHESLDYVDSKRNTSKKITGIAFGVTAGGSLILDGAAYREIILLFNEDHSLQLTLVSALEGGLSLSLPVALGATTTFINGCYDVADYIGAFATGTLAGVSANVGYTSLNPFKTKRTFCDARTVNDGSSTQIVGFGVSHWEKRSRIYQVSGPRVERLIQFFSKNNVSRSDLRCN
jgi:hypothetical protein